MAILFVEMLDQAALAGIVTLQDENGGWSLLDEDTGELLAVLPQEASYEEILAQVEALMNA